METVMILRWLLAREEERLASRDDPRKSVRQMEVGLQELSGAGSESASLEALFAICAEHEASTDAFFAVPEYSDFRLQGRDLVFDSSVKTESTSNNRVPCRIFETGDLSRAVLIVPHWNSTAAPYDRLAKWLSRLGIPAMCISLPYHDARSPIPGSIADRMVSPNLGLTIRSVRQAVVDARRAIDWLDQRGYRQIGILGASIGSCVASIVAAHDHRVRALAQLLTASDFAEVVWTGRATRHIRQSLEAAIGLEELKRAWAILSPITYVEKLRIPVLVVSGRLDTVFLPYLTERLVEAYRRCGVRCRWHRYACGHYTLGVPPWNVLSLLCVRRFFSCELK
jgi:dienelactone hydrolase